MKIKIIGKKEERQTPHPHLAIQPSVKIIAWRDGGHGDVFFAYATLKAIKRKFPNSSIRFLFPHGNFEILRNHNICQSVEHMSYQQIYQIMHSWNDHCDVFFNLRPRTFSLYDKDKFIGTNLEEHIKISTQRQLDAFGNDFLIRPIQSAEERIYGRGQIPACKVYSHLHNLDVNFQDSSELITKHHDYKNFIVPDFKYITIHQHAYTGGTGWNTKFWTSEHWQELAKMLKQEFGVPVVQIGAGNETFLGGNDIDNWLGKSSFFGNCKLIQNSLIHIDIEGSLVHSAVLLGSKCVALRGASMLYWTHPDATNIRYVSAAPSCCELMPCEVQKRDWWLHCHQQHHNCMNQLLPEQVFEAVRQMTQNL